MNLRELAAGDIHDLSVRPLEDGSLLQLATFESLDLHPLEGAQLALSQRGSRVVVRAVGKEATRTMATLPRPECRVATLIATDHDCGVLRIWTFGRGLILGREPARIHLGDSVLQSIGSRQGGTVTDDSCQEWMRNKFLLPGDQPSVARVVARVDQSESALGSAFTLIGADSELDVRQLDRSLHATRLAPRRQDSSLSSVLVEGRLEFSTDLAGSADGSPPLATMLAEGGYLRRWSLYNEMEFQEEEELSAGIGEGTYSSAEILSTGAWRFQLTESADFLNQLEPGMPIAAVGTAALVPGKRRSTFTGEVEFVRKADRSIDVRALSSSETPPLEGNLRYAITGSSVSYQRRLDAAQRLASGAVPLPELGAILEMRSAPTRSVDRRLGWDSPATRAIFGGAEPTDAQKRAIEVGLNTPDIAVIQGPPGTGKTKVIAAIAARVAEESDSEAAARQVLLTSYQHDAVDNVASRTTVFGLPTVKEGRGEHGGRWLQAWRQDRLRHAADLFSEVDQGDIAELRDWIRERREAYILGPSSSDSAGELLEDAASRAQEFLPARLVEDLRSTANRLQGSRTGAERDRNLLASIRAIRTTSDAHADDGQTNAARLLQRLEKTKNAEGVDLRPIEDASTREVLSIEALAATRSTKDLLLDVFGLIGVQTATPTLNGDVVRLLGEVMLAIDERLRQEGKGIATVLARFVHDLETNPTGVELALGGYAAVIAATCQASASLAARPEASSDLAPVNTVIVDEAARANPLDLQIPMCLASRRVVLVGDQRQLPHIVDNRIGKAVATSETEAKELEESLFGRVFRFLVAERHNGRPDRAVTLNSQFRMHPTLGRFVSRSFYEPHGETLESPLGSDPFAHALPGYEGRCAAWIDVPRNKGPEGRSGKSRLRDIEARMVAAEVHRLMEAEPNLTFGVVSFYRAQKLSILEELLHLGVAGYDADSGELGVFSSHWRYTTNHDGEVVERLRVGTVDAFQGKEFDVVILSTVRSPRKATTSVAAAFGHLVVANRLCVSMSRQRRLLIVVGDRAGLLEHPAAEEHLKPLCEFARLCDEQAT